MNFPEKLTKPGVDDFSILLQFLFIASRDSLEKYGFQSQILTFFCQQEKNKHHKVLFTQVHISKGEVKVDLIFRQPHVPIRKLKLTKKKGTLQTSKNLETRAKNKKTKNQSRGKI